MSPTRIRITFSGKGLHTAASKSHTSTPKNKLLQAKFAQNAQISRDLQQKGQEYQSKFFDFCTKAVKANNPTMSPAFYLQIVDDAQELSTLLSEVFELMDRQSASSSKPASSSVTPSKNSADALDELSALAATLSISEVEGRKDLIEDFSNALGKLSLF